MDSDWRKRLRDAMKEKGFNMKSLSKAAGLGETYVRDLLEREREPSLDGAQKICSKLGEPITEIFGLWDGASDISESPEPSFPLVPDGFVPIGRFDATFSMGPGSLIPPEPEPMGHWVFESQWLRDFTHALPADLAIVRVGGDSMQPTLLPGDWVLVDRCQNRPTREGIYAIRVEDQAWVKRVSINLKSKKIRILSDNPLVPKQPEMAEGEISIIGRVVALVARKIP